MVRREKMSLFFKFFLGWAGLRYKYRAWVDQQWAFGRYPGAGNTLTSVRSGSPQRCQKQKYLQVLRDEGRSLWPEQMDNSRERSELEFSKFFRP